MPEKPTRRKAPGVSPTGVERRTRRRREREDRRIDPSVSPTGAERRGRQRREELPEDTERRKQEGAPTGGVERRVKQRREELTEKQKAQVFTSAIKLGLEKKIIPVCSFCGAVRITSESKRFFNVGISKTGWESIAKKKGFNVSHSICSRCAKIHYGYG